MTYLLIFQFQSSHIYSKSYQHFSTPTVPFILQHRSRNIISTTIQSNDSPMASEQGTFSMLQQYDIKRKSINTTHNSKSWRADITFSISVKQESVPDWPDFIFEDTPEAALQNATLIQQHSYDFEQATSSQAVSRHWKNCLWITRIGMSSRRY